MRRFRLLNQAGWPIEHYKVGLTYQNNFPSEICQLNNDLISDYKESWPDDWEEVFEDKSGWISVKDRLPDDNWIFCWMPSQRTFTKGYYLSRSGWELQGFANTIEVTHWMPLPEPPIDEK